jgi:hypothetical protein
VREIMIVFVERDAHMTNVYERNEVFSYSSKTKEVIPSLPE